MEVEKMPSITDELMGKIPGGAQKTAEATYKAMKGVGAGIKGAESAVKGICLLLLNGTEFTTESVMKAVYSVAFKKTGDIRFSKNNIDISKLRKSGHVYPVEENIMQEVMKYFDQQCKKYGIKYSAMKDTRGDDKPDYKPSYMVFFEGKDTDLILQALREAYKDYAEEQQRDKDTVKNEPQKEQNNKGRDDKKKDSKEKEGTERQQKRESVKAKLAFFRDRVTARNKERDAVEKHHQHTDIQR